MYSSDGKVTFFILSYKAIITMFTATRSFRNHSKILIWCLRNIYYT